MSEWITALADGAALLLVASGWAKLYAPPATAAAIAALIRRPAPGDRVQTRRWLAARLHSDDRTVLARGVGLAEIAVAVLVLAAGGRLAAGLLAATYLAFLAAAARLRAVAAGASCGCFGAASAPVGRGHLVVCAAAALTGLAGAVSSVAPSGALLGSAPWSGAVLLALAVLLAALAYLSLTALPQLSAAGRGAPP